MSSLSLATQLANNARLRFDNQKIGPGKNDGGRMFDGDISASSHKKEIISQPGSPSSHPKTGAEIILGNDAKRIKEQIEKVNNKFGIDAANYYAAQIILKYMVDKNLIIPTEKADGSIDYELSEEMKGEFSPLFFDSDNKETQDFMKSEILKSTYVSLIGFGNVVNNKLNRQLEAQEDLAEAFSKSPNILPEDIIKNLNKYLEDCGFPSSIRVISSNPDGTLNLSGITKTTDQKLVLLLSAEDGGNSLPRDSVLQAGLSHWTSTYVNQAPADPRKVVKGLLPRDSNPLEVTKKAEEKIFEAEEEYRQTCARAAQTVKEYMDKHYPNSDVSEIKAQKRQVFQRVIDKLEENENTYPWEDQTLEERAKALEDSRSNMIKAIDEAQQNPLVSEHHGFFAGLKSSFKNAAYGIVNFFRSIFGKEALEWKTGRERILDEVKRPLSSEH